MEKNKFGLKISETLFLFAGLGILVSLPWIEGVGFNLWFMAKIAYFLGLAIFTVQVFGK